MSKAKEFWIRKTKTNCLFAYTEPFETDNLIHVVEKSAYNKLLKAVKSGSGADKHKVLTELGELDES